MKTINLSTDRSLHVENGIIVRLSITIEIMHLLLLKGILLELISDFLHEILKLFCRSSYGINFWTFGIYICYKKTHNLTPTQTTVNPTVQTWIRKWISSVTNKSTSCFEPLFIHKRCWTQWDSNVTFLKSSLLEIQAI